ncbi:MAG: hypothetical protein IPN42_13815 [Methylococcaceae bacterium]|nr:hypothetical protein [Methylococcaceae bacterium]
MEYSEYITKTKAVKDIAERTCNYPKNKTELRTEKNKINGQIDTRIKNKTIATNEKGLLRFLDVSKYAKQKFPGKFDDWPDIGIVCEMSLIGFVAEGMGHILPSDIAECHDIIKERDREIFRLRGQVEHWKRDAEKGTTYRKIKGGRDKS